MCISTLKCFSINSCRCWFSSLSDGEPRWRSSYSSVLFLGLLLPRQRVSFFWCLARLSFQGVFSTQMSDLPHVSQSLYFHFAAQNVIFLFPAMWTVLPGIWLAFEWRTFKMTNRSEPRGNFAQSRASSFVSLWFVYISLRMRYLWERSKKLPLVRSIARPEDALLPFSFGKGCHVLQYAVRCFDCCDWTALLNIYLFCSKFCRGYCSLFSSLFRCITDSVDFPHVSQRLHCCNSIVFLWESFSSWPSAKRRPAFWSHTTEANISRNPPSSFEYFDYTTYVSLRILVLWERGAGNVFFFFLSFSINTGRRSSRTESG